MCSLQACGPHIHHAQFLVRKTGPCAHGPQAHLFLKAAAAGWASPTGRSYLHQFFQMPHISREGRPRCPLGSSAWAHTPPRHEHTSFPQAPRPTETLDRVLSPLMDSVSPAPLRLPGCGCHTPPREDTGPNPRSLTPPANLRFLCFCGRTGLPSPELNSRLNSRERHASLGTRE